MTKLCCLNWPLVTARCLVFGHLCILPSAFCLALHGILREEGSYSRDTQVLLRMKTHFPYHICRRAYRSGISFVHPACPPILSSSPGVPFPSPSLPGGLLSKALHKRMYSMAVLQMQQMRSDLNSVPGEKALQCAVL